eukprot:337619_1
MTTISDYLDELAKSYTSKPTGWAILKNPPAFRYRQPHPIFYKDLEGNRYFILTPGPKNNAKNLKINTTRKKSQKNESYKYNITVDKFISIPKIKFSSISSSFSHVIHSKEHKLYIIGSFCVFFDLLNNKWKMQHSFEQNLSCPRICYINRTIHIIHNNIHYILDTDNHKTKTIESKLNHKFKYFPDSQYELLCSESTNKLYVFGGGMKLIYEYDLSNQIWKISKFKLPFAFPFRWKNAVQVAKMIVFGNVFVIFDFDERYLYYLDLGNLKQDKFIKIKFNYIHGKYHKCPKVCVTDDNQRVHFMNCKSPTYHVSISLKELLPKLLVTKYTYIFVIGYVNHQCKYLRMDANKIPIDIVNMIALFYGAVKDW